jgi:hypothetical protein
METGFCSCAITFQTQSTKGDHVQALITATSFYSFAHNNKQISHSLGEGGSIFPLAGKYLTLTLKTAGTFKILAT